VAPSLITDIVNSFDPICLGEMERVWLMNRIDTKYVMSVHRLPDLLSVLSRDYKILEMEGLRAFPYFTKYLDTSGFRFFNQHVTGRPVRHKVRYRTYLSAGTTWLEIKKRSANGRTIKWRIKNDLRSDGTPDPAACSFIEQYLPGGSQGLKPVLINRFERITLVGSEINERATIDFDISFTNMLDNQLKYPCMAIIELKRDGRQERSPVADAMKALSVRSSGFSKYCFGVSELYDIPRKFILKEKLSLLKKIEYEYNRCRIA
jgi:hypothetical protein